MSRYAAVVNHARPVGVLDETPHIYFHRRFDLIHPFQVDVLLTDIQ